MENNIKKPMTVVRQEFIDTMIDHINKSGLPLFVIESILKELYMETKTAAQHQYEVEKLQYENSLKKNDVQQPSNVDV